MDEKTFCKEQILTCFTNESMPVLQAKSQKLMGELKKYRIEYAGYSLEDM